MQSGKIDNMLRIQHLQGNDLINAGIEGDWKEIDAILNARPEQIHFQLDISRTVFYWIALAGHYNIIDQLLKHTAYTNQEITVKCLLLSNASGGCDDRAEHLDDDLALAQTKHYLILCGKLLAENKNILTAELKNLQQEIAKLEMEPTFLEDKNKLIQITKAYGFSYSNIPMDGNCFFHAIADQLVANNFFSQHDYLHLYLRKILKDHMEYNYDVYRGWIPEEKENYLNKLATPKSWVYDVGVMAMAHELNITLVIINSNGSKPTISQPATSHATFYLGFVTNSHYLSLKQDPTQKPTKDLVDLASPEILDLPVVSNHNILLAENRAKVIADLAKLRAADTTRINYSYGINWSLFSSKPTPEDAKVAPANDIGGYDATCTIM